MSKFPKIRKFMAECPHKRAIAALMDCIDVLDGGCLITIQSYWFGYAVGCLETLWGIGLMTDEEFFELHGEIFHAGGDET